MGEAQSFGQWLRRRRRELDLTQEELGHRVGCAPITIRKLEADQMRPSKQLAELLLERMGVPAEERESLVHFARGGEPTESVTAVTPKHNLPHPVSSFIGREREIAEVKRLMGMSRLVTLTGAGGSGKTRLAIEVAAQILDQFEDGAWFVGFAPLSESALVQQTIASALGVREDSSRPLVETLTDYLYPKKLLLLFDNCEHLIAECAQTAERLLQACPQLHLLVTSREALGLAGEEQYYVPTLSLPEAEQINSLESLNQSEAVSLFVNRAALMQPTFVLTAANAKAVAQICRRLDGMPLAIELAAARVKLLTVEHIAEGLDDRFNLLSGGSRTALPRQQTLRATIEWSYNLLPEGTKVLFRRLSVFAGGFGRHAAEAVCSDDVLTESAVLAELSRLVDRSLVEVVQKGEEERYRMLETIRMYAREKLQEAGEEAPLRNRHLEYFTEWTEQVEPKLRGPEQMVWWDQIEMEHSNIRSALNWSLSSGEAETGLRLAIAAHWFWYTRGYWREGLKWLRDILAGIPDRAWTRARAKAVAAAGMLALEWSLVDSLGDDYEGSLAYWRQMGDDWWTAYALTVRGWHSLYVAEIASARAQFEEAVAFARKSGDDWILGYSLRALGAAIQRIDYATARLILEECVLHTQASGDRWEHAEALNQLGLLPLHDGDYASAVVLFEEALKIYKEMQDRVLITNPLAGLAQAMLGLRDTVRAARYERERMLIARNMGYQSLLAYAVIGYGYVAEAEGRLRRSTTLLTAGEALLNSIGMTETVFPTEHALYERCLAHAREQLGESDFDRASAQGRAMTLDEAVKYALEESKDG